MFLVVPICSFLVSVVEWALAPAICASNCQTMICTLTNDGSGPHECFDKLFGRWYSEADENGRRNRHKFSFALFHPDGAAVINLQGSIVTGRYERHEIDDDNLRIVLNGDQFFTLQFGSPHEILLRYGDDKYHLKQGSGWFGSPSMAEIEERLFIDLRLLQRGQLLNGKKEGVWEVWRTDGTQEKLESFSGGISHGAFTSWHPNGKLFEFGGFVNGRRDGKWAFWDVEGNPIGKSTYTNGTVTNGVYVEWHSVGVQPSKIGMLREGMKQGVWREYDPDGSLLQIVDHGDE